MAALVARADVVAWVQRYRAAWESNDPAAIGALFTDDARYVTGPFDEPWVGRDVIVQQWLGRKDEPGETEFQYEIVAIDGELAVVEGYTDYRKPPRRYGNIWLLRLAEKGRAAEFIEWWVEAKESGGE